MSSLSAKITVVVRNAGERTSGLCQSLIRKQIDPGSIEIVTERPFSVAQEKSMRLALEAGQEWSLFVDADVLLIQNALDVILSELTASTEAFYMMNFLVLDRGFGGPTYAGIHAYRTSMFRKALEFMDFAHQDQRPETRLCKEMARLGYPTTLSKSIVGLHDYEQYYRDLYRKMFVRAVKFKNIAVSMKEMFSMRYATEPEQQVMLWGLVDGLFYYHGGHPSAPLDVNFYMDKSEYLLNMLEIQEREPLPENFEIAPEQIINTFVPGGLYEEVLRPALFSGESLTYYGYDNASANSFIGRIKKVMRKTWHHFASGRALL